MKKFILNAIAIVCISLISFANSSELKAPLNLELDTVKTVVNNEDDKLQWCLEYYRETITDPISNTTTTYIYVACVDVIL